MKNIIKITLIFLSFFSISSCSKDDDTTTAISLVGKWEYYKTGSNEDRLSIYEHLCSTKNDFIEFTQTSSAETSYGSGCETYTGTYPSYKNESNRITFYKGGNQVDFYYEIISLTETELKVKLFYNTDTSARQVIVFKK